jgi:hypothetical protein
VGPAGEGSLTAIDEGGSHAGGFGADTVELVVGDEENFVEREVEFACGHFVRGSVRFESVGLGDRDHGIEGDAVMRSGGFQHVRIAVRQNSEFVVLTQAGEGRGDLGEGAQTLDGGDKGMYFFLCVGNAGAVHDLTDREVADLAVGDVVALQQGVDHGVFEMGAAPPGDEGVGIASPILGLEERGGEFAQTGLHVDDGAVLVEYAELYR